MKSNTAQLKIAEKYLGESCPRCCSMSNNCCCYYVCKVFRESGNASLFYNGVTVTYCPNARKWCKANLAEIPLFIAMPSDVIFFDWENNGEPNHIGFVDHRYTDQQICTLEGNTTSRYVVAKRVREAKYVQGIYRPQFKASYDISKPLAIDGQFNYSSIAMLQKALGIKVDGILGRDTVKAMQKKVGVSQDGAWGAKTSKALQTMLKKEGFYKGAIDGLVYEGTVKALQQWCNKHASAKPTPQPTPKPTPAPSGELVVDGKGGTATVKAMQKFFGTTVDGVISGQNEDLAKYYPSLEAVEFGKGGSACIKKLQKWVGANEDGVLGQITVKLWQKKIGVTPQDGIFGVNSMKKWQTYLNGHEKATYPTKVTNTVTKVPTTNTTTVDKVVAWAKKIANDNSYHYVAQTKSDSPANHCCLCKGIKSGKYHGWNCIRFVGAAFAHGGGVKIKSADHKLVTTDFANKMLKATPANALKMWEERNGSGWKLIKNGNKKIPSSMLKKGDVLVCFDKEGSSATYKHMALYAGDGKIVDATSSNGIAIRNYSSLGVKTLMAFRYTK